MDICIVSSFLDTPEGLQNSSLHACAFLFVKEIIKNKGARSRNMKSLFPMHFSTGLFRSDYFSTTKNGRNEWNNSIILRLKISELFNRERIAFIGKDNI